MNPKHLVSLCALAACSFMSHAATTIATESSNFTLGAATTVTYGVPGAPSQQQASKYLNAGAYTCDNALFGDPSPGFFKSCLVDTPAASSSPSLLATEFATFTLAGPKTVSYGAPGATAEKQFSKLLNAGTYLCGNALFGDSAPGTLKVCTTTTTTTTTKTLAGEFSTFVLTTPTTVTYGANGKIVSKLLAAGTYLCGNNLFGDPVVGIAKSCTAESPSNSATPTPTPTPTPAPGPLKVVELANGFSNPWSLAFLPDGRMLVTERGGQLRLRNADGSASNNGSDLICCVPPVDSEGQGGLLDVAIDPNFANNRRIYFTFAERIGPVNGAAVGRAELDVASRTLSNVTVIFRQEPKISGSSMHYGSRLAFDRSGNLFVTMGERSIDSQRGFAQALDRGNGKVMHITTDGIPVSNNPFVAKVGAQPAIWSYGHRNPQGAAMRPGTDQLWTSEHGPQGGDEVNLTLPGRNYGWPIISYGQEYGGTTQIGEGTAKAGMEQPAAYWEKIDGSAWTGGQKSSIAPSGIAFYNADRLPGWKGNLFVGSLAGTSLWRLVLDGDKVVQRERLLAERGERIRDVRQGTDGWLYMLTDNGKLLRLER